MYPITSQELQFTRPGGKMRIFGTIAYAALIFIISCPQVFSEQEKVIQARIHLQTKADYILFESFRLDDYQPFENYVDVFVDDETMRKLQASDLKIDIIHDDLVAFYQSRLMDKDMGGYMTLSEIESQMSLMHLNYPDITTEPASIGQTIQGRNIWAFKISDNPDIDENEPEVLYTAAIHAREVITPLVLFHFIDHLLTNYGIDSEITALIDNRELWFILCVNPDGYYHNQVIQPNGGGMWRKNRRNNGDGTYGIDLNRNFGYEWGYDNEGSSPITSDDTYRGTGPFSEPETQAIRDFITSRNFVISMFYHSYSNLLLWPYGYLDGLITPDNDIFTEIGDTVNAFNGYIPGPSWQLYVVNGSSDDWIYGEQTLKDKIFAMTMEVGSQADGFWPATSRIPQLVSENLGPNLFLARIADKIYTLKPPAVPELYVANTVNSSGFNLHWTHTDTLNPAVSFELQELQNFQPLTDPAESFEGWSDYGFKISAARSYSAPSSFFSGTGNNREYYVQTDNPYTVQPNDTLKLRIWYAIEEDWDYGYVEVSTDSINFAPLPGNITTDYNPHSNNRGNGITGFSSGWAEGRFGLGTYVGQDIWIRVSYYTDAYLNEEGFYIDDIYPVMGFATKTDFAATDTTYTFSSKTPGDYFYRVRARDVQNQWSDYCPIVPVAVVDGPAYSCGDVTDDGSVNLIDILYIIDFLYGIPAGPQPEPMVSGDASGDGNVNLIDILYLIDYIYGSPPGPEPICEG